MRSDISTPRSPKKPFKVAIVGGGIGGLSLAIGLHSRGVPVQIYEAAPAFTEVGAGIGMDPNSIQAMTLIDERIGANYLRLVAKKTKKVDRDTWLTFRCAVGEPELIARVRTGQPEKTFSSVHRAHFLQGMVDLLPKEIAHLNKRLASIDDGPSGPVRLTFEDGSSAEADAVIGCDGVKSVVRRMLLRKSSVLEDLSFSGKCAYRGLVPMDKAKEALGEYLATSSSMYLGPGAHVLTYPIAHGTIVNVVAFKDRDDGWPHQQWVVKKPKEEMIGDFQGMGRHVQQILKVRICPGGPRFAASSFNHLNC